MKKHQVVIILSILCIITVHTSSAQNLKFGYINKDELLKAMPEYDSASQKVEKFRGELVSQLGVMQNEFNSKSQAYNNDFKNMPDALRKSKEAELKSLDNMIQLFQVKATQQISDKSNELLQPVLAKADKAIKDVAKEQGIALVFDAAVLYYTDDRRGVNMLPLIKTKLGLK